MNDFSVAITLNGEALITPAGSTVADVLDAQALESTAVATAINGEFVARVARAERLLCTGDALFTFQPIVGG